MESCEVGEFLQTFFQLSASIDGTTVRHGITLHASSYNENNAEPVYQETDNFYQPRDQHENMVRVGFKTFMDPCFRRMKLTERMLRSQM